MLLETLKIVRTCAKFIHGMIFVEVIWNYIVCCDFYFIFFLYCSKSFFSSYTFMLTVLVKKSVFSTLLAFSVKKTKTKKHLSFSSFQLILFRIRQIVHLSNSIKMAGNTWSALIKMTKYWPHILSLIFQTHNTDICIR